MLHLEGKKKEKAYPTSKKNPTTVKVSCITLLSTGIQAGLDLDDLFCLHIFESKFPVGKL